jgi:hypothetical protein
MKQPQFKVVMIMPRTMARAVHFALYGRVMPALSMLVRA